MPQIIVSTALASQIFIRYAEQPNAHVIMPGREIERVTITGTGAQKRMATDEQGKKKATPDEIDFATTVLRDEQYEWLQENVSFQQMVEKGWLRAMPLTDKEAVKLDKQYKLESAVEHLVPTMKSKSDQKDRQMTDADFRRQDGSTPVAAS